MLDRLKEHFSPSDEILDAIEKAERLYQVMNQNAIEVYLEKGQDSNYSGSLFDYIEMQEAKDILDVEEAPWRPLVKAIRLRHAFDPRVDVRELKKLSKEDIITYATIVQEGLGAQDILTEWVKSLNGEDWNAEDAILDATKVKFRNDGYGMRVLKMADLGDAPADRSVVLYEDILQIEDPEDMVNFLKTGLDRNFLFLAIQKDAKRDFRSTFYLFLALDGKLYSIDTHDCRANQDNTKGERNPDKYLRHRYENIHLPFYLLWDEYNKEQTKLPALKDSNGKLLKLATFTEVDKKQPTVMIWLEIFLLRVLNHIRTEEVPVGLTQTSALKMLGTGEVETAEVQEFESYSYGRNQYLADKYYNNSDEKSLVVVDTNLPALIGTEEHIKEVIAYKKQTALAEEIKKRIVDDWKKNRKKVAKKIENIIKSKSPEEIILRALEDKKYTFTRSEKFGDRSFLEEDEITRTIGDTEQSIMSFKKEKILNTFIGWGNCNLNTYYLGTPKDEYTAYFGGQKYQSFKCYACGAGMKRLIELSFKDYKQFLGFFELKEKDVPKELIEHLHDMNETYLGNNILDDIDPIDLIKDPWFRQGVDTVEDAKNCVNRRYDYSKDIRVKIAVCERCFKKFLRRLKKKEEDFED